MRIDIKFEISNAILAVLVFFKEASRRLISDLNEFQHTKTFSINIFNGNTFLIAFK